MSHGLTLCVCFKPATACCILLCHLHGQNKRTPAQCRIRAAPLSPNGSMHTLTHTSTCVRAGSFREERVSYRLRRHNHCGRHAQPRFCNAFGVSDGHRSRCVRSVVKTHHSSRRNLSRKNAHSWSCSRMDETTSQIHTHRTRTHTHTHNNNNNVEY